LIQFINALSRDEIILDLGCGNGSFHYEACSGTIIALDTSFSAGGPRNASGRVHYLRADSNSIPLADHSVDAVVCHHTLEHFSGYQEALSEIKRVLNPQGWLWVAVPNGNGLDDHLYRWIFSGGGHVNRFTREGLIGEVLRTTGLRLLAECALFSGFVYLKKPSATELEHYPPSARPLAKIPDGLSTFGALALNAVTRIADKVVGSRLSQYGWGFIFSNAELLPPSLPSYFNVCRKCGSGHLYQSVATRTVLGIGIYHCPGCRESNVCVAPPGSLD
jgi:SAM-dependent methyltransferase